MTTQQLDISNPNGVEETASQLRLFRRGSIHFAVLENEIVAISAWSVPTPLPNAPDSVLGVISVQGRILTVLDLAKIADANAGMEETDIGHGQRQILGLRGDEQLALVVDALEETVAVSDEALSKRETENLLTVLQHNGSELRLLNPSQLFASAIQGRERRRRRF